MALRSIHSPGKLLATCCCRTPTVFRPSVRLPSPWATPRSTSRTFSRSSFPRAAEPPKRTPTIEDYRSAQKAKLKARNRSLALYALSIGVVTLGLSYAAVPLYRAFCSATGFGGTPMTSITKGEGKFAPERMKALVGGGKDGKDDRWITVRFNADSSDALPWRFWPCQRSVRVRPGETALAFYKAKNLSDRDVLGIATYNVTPGQIAPYFAKVECFCFDEQRLLAGEEVDLPIFFFIDQDFADDPLMRDIDDIVLSYTFFKARRNPISGSLEPDTPPEST